MPYRNSMFSRIALRDSFKYLATDQEWSEFTAFGEVSANDLWVDSLAAGLSDSSPTKFDHYETLWSRFAAAARQKLLAGAWTAEGFDANVSASPQPIIPELWRSLEFYIQDAGAVGAGFKFVNLLISCKHAPESEPVLKGPVTLMELLDLVATSAEAAEYAPLKFAAQRPPVRTLGNVETEYERLHRLCRELQGKLWDRILPSLLDGRWSAEGYIADSVALSAIPPKRWPSLSCDFARGEVYSTGGSDLHLYDVTVIQPHVEATRTSQTEMAGIRRRLIEWIRTELNETAGPLKKGEMLKRGRAAFPADSITDNLFSEAWRSAGIPLDRRQKGRPRK